MNASPATYLTLESSRPLGELLLAIQPINSLGVDLPALTSPARVLAPRAGSFEGFRLDIIGAASERHSLIVTANLPVKRWT